MDYLDEIKNVEVSMEIAKKHIDDNFKLYVTKSGIFEKKDPKRALQYIRIAKALFELQKKYPEDIGYQLTIGMKEVVLINDVGEESDLHYLLSKMEKKTVLDVARKICMDKDPLTMNIAMLTMNIHSLYPEESESKDLVKYVNENQIK